MTLGTIATAAVILNFVSRQDMASRLWQMNADFEAELAARAGAYRRPPHLEDLNRRLSEHLLWLA